MGVTGIAGSKSSFRIKILLIMGKEKGEERKDVKGGGRKLARSTSREEEL